MDIKSRLIIGLSGQKGSGKDLTASIIDYIVKRNIRGANYKDWVLYDVANKDKELKTIVHFADPLKEFISKLFNINIKYFYDRNYKDNKYIKLAAYTSGKCTITNAFISEEEAKNKKYLIVTYDELIRLPLSYWMLNNNMCIKIRTLLQYIGTDIGKQLIDNSLWTKLIANTISTKATKYRLCIIPDVRFTDEAETIKKLGGIIIKINRNIESNNNDKHISEYIDNIKEDYIIDNNGTKFNLFYNIFNIINTVYREKREIIESRNNS